MPEVQINTILSFLWAFGISVFAIPSIITVAHNKNLLDEPNHRTVHATLTPRLGGMAIFAGFVSAITIFGDLNHALQRVVAGCILLFFIGLKDDITNISAAKKFFVQIMATGIVIFLGNIRITNFQGFMGIYDLDPGISYGFTFLVIIGITNAVNLIDGLDGLAGSITVVISAIFGFYFYMNGQFGFSYLAFSLMGGVFGFLRYNLTRAIIFMGDTGSLVCGFLVSIMAIQFVEMGNIESAPSISIAILFVPILDTARVFALRILQGKSPFAADKNHIHHVLTRYGASQRATVLVLVIFNFLVAITVIQLDYLGDTVLVAALIGLFLAVTLIIEVADRISGRGEGVTRTA